MSSATSTVTLRNLVDLALGTPEIGAVNFNVLHTLLHLLIRKWGIDNCKVEFRGPDADRIDGLMSQVPTTPSMLLKELPVLQDAASGVPLLDKDSVTLVTPARGGLDADLASGRKKSPTFLGKHACEQLEKRVEHLESQLDVLSSLPSNQDLIGRTKEQGAPAPVSDMWRFLNLSKRMVAAEDAIAKLTSMFEDLAKETDDAKTLAAQALDTLQEHQNNMIRIENKIDDLFNKLLEDAAKLWEFLGGDTCTLPPGIFGSGNIYDAAKLQGIPVPITRVPSISSRRSSRESARIAPVVDVERDERLVDLAEGNANTDAILQSVTEDLDIMRRDIDNLASQLGELVAATENIPFDELVKGMKQMDSIKDQLAILYAAEGEGEGESEGEREREPEGEREGECKCEREGEGVTKAERSLRGSKDSEKSKEGKKESKGSKEMVLPHIKRMDEALASQMDNFQRQLDNLENELGVVMEKLNSGGSMLGGEVYGQDTAGVGDVLAKIQAMQAEVDNFRTAINRLLGEDEDRQAHINALLEQVEMLKAMKADKEDIEEALADKADTGAVNRKVSHEQFDAICDDLTKQLDDASQKLTDQETMWQQALEGVQKDLGTKLDKGEISPLKDYVRAKLKNIQQKLKALAAMKEEREAAGSKKVLRNLNCISCDKDVVMKTQLDAPGVPAPAPFPGKQDIRPYLTYELDLIRKQKKKLPIARGPRAFEQAGAEERARKKLKPPPEETSVPFHLCNRYCGGSHTVTTAQQRVARVGHFYNQYGPECICTPEGFIEGMDGNMYKARVQLRRPMTATQPPQNPPEEKRPATATSG